MKLNFEEKYAFTAQMAMILDAGFDMIQGVEMIKEESDNPHIQETCQNILHHLQVDSRLSDAIKKTDAFDHYMIHLLEVGELSGHLDEVMLSLSQYYERMTDMSRQLQQALTYPMVLLMMMFVVIGVIVFKVLPIFQDVLKSLGSDLSQYAYTFMRCGQIFSFIGFCLLAVVLVALIVFYVYAKITQISLLTLFIDKVPFMKKLSNALSHAQMTYALSMFMSSGYEIEQAVEYTIPLVQEKKLSQQLKACYRDMLHQVAFLDAIASHSIYQGMKLNMLQVGEKTGRMDSVLTKLAVTYQDEVNISITHFLNVIEPAIVTFLSVIVGIVLLSVMLPIVSILSSL